ncbi:MAG: Wzz/FepE/Etk N-terminal domain-containing protein [Pseudomonadota bacterium]
MAELALEQTLDFGDYLAAFRRRRGMIALVAGIVFLLGLIIALVWPPTYQASATILIEEQEIPTELIQSTVTSYAAQRIQVISQRVMSRANLLDIIEKYHLYEKERRLNTIEEVLNDMRGDITIDMINADVMDPRTGRPTAATIAFTLGYKSDNPQQALKVANELTTLYLDENLKSRTEKAAETYDFLTEEASRLSDDISRLEKELAEFKEKNVNTLPELRDLNTQILERTEREIADIDAQTRGLEERRVYLNGQLAVMDPYGGSNTLSPSARLDALRTEYIGLISRYSPDHPDVTRVRREIRALEQETGQGPSNAEIQAQLQALRDQLATARQTYTDEHPDVKSLNRQISNLEQELREASAAPGANMAPPRADNPAYVTLQSQLVAATTEMRSLQSKRAQLVQKVAEYESRLMQTPRSEQEYSAIVRDLENSTRRYQEIRAKQMTAEVAQEMEKERKGEKFTLIDPAILPEEPVSPNRGAIVFLSLVLALGASVGSAAVSESMDKAVRGVKGVTMLLHTAPLAVIPYLPNTAENSGRKRRRTLIVVTLLAGLVVLLLLVHFLVTPLDVMLFKALRKFDQLTGA